MKPTEAKPRLLVIGGSGFVSGTLARTALEQGYDVTTVTRGIRPPLPGTHPLTADRGDREGFARLFRDDGRIWDLVVDAIGYNGEDARQDIATFTRRARHLVFISTDFVYDPRRRRSPQREHEASYSASGYGGLKRQAEEVIQGADAGKIPWTILRACHVYGPGSLLGCLPLHGRDPQLPDHLRRGAPVRLVGGGKFLQQPLFALDLARTILSAAANQRCAGRTINVAGPETIESRDYYRVLATVLGCGITIEDVSVESFLAQHPDKAPFCCDRVGDLAELRAAGLAVPGTPLADGLRLHAASLPRTDGAAGTPLPPPAGKNLPGGAATGF